MAIIRQKGAGQGGCCCGGCRTPPSDPRAGAGALEKVIEARQRCCTCIPKQVCISVAYDGVTTLALVPKGCGDATYEGDPIQYRTTFVMDDESYTLNFRFSVVDELCYLAWDIPELELSDSTLIDHSDLANPEECNHGMISRQCAHFGESWTVIDPALEIAINEVDSLDLQDLIECAGCICICNCMCISIYSRNSTTGIFTLVGSNDVVCSTFSREAVSGCGITEFYHTPWIASWVSHGWTISIGDMYDRQISTHTVVSGTESVSGTCTVRDAVWLGDGNEHTIEGESIQVVYEWELEHRIAKSFKWVGRSYDEGSVVRFDAWNWVTSAWDLVTSVGGRPVTTPINRAKVINLAASYTGTGVDEGKVKLRLTAHYATALHTDMLRITTGECCALTLTPPESITLEEPPARIPLTLTNACPSPNPFWQVTEDDGTEWYISASCSWCGGTCGTVATTCCPRPLGNNLFAEVTLGCPTCAPIPIAVPLVSGGTGAIWSGTVTICSQTLTVTFSCTETGWHINVTLGTCTYSGTATSVDCDTFTVTFGGILGGGLGCCGPTGDPFATPSIGIMVFE